MKTAIIGAGNMGGSIARGLAKGSIIPASDIIVSNPSQGKLDELKVEFPALQITHDNQEAIIGAEFIILAVKPWLIKSVLRELKLKSKQIIISVAAGINFEELAHYVPEPEMTMFRIIPNTAISEMESMTLIASRNATKEQEQLMLDIFNQMGLAMLIPEEKFAAMVQESTTSSPFSPSNSMPLGWKGSTTSGFQTIRVGAAGSSTERIATSVRWPLPVAASEP